MPLLLPLPSKGDGLGTNGWLQGLSSSEHGLVAPGVCNCALGLQCDWWVQGGGEMEGNIPESL